MSRDGSYAPKSPDLSSFYSSGPTQPPAQPPLAAAPAPPAAARPPSQSPQQPFYHRPGSAHQSPVQFSHAGTSPHLQSHSPQTYYSGASSSPLQSRPQQLPLAPQFPPTPRSSLSGGYSQPYYPHVPPQAQAPPPPSYALQYPVAPPPLQPQQQQYAQPPHHSQAQNQQQALQQPLQQAPHFYQSYPKTPYEQHPQGAPIYGLAPPPQLVGVKEEVDEQKEVMPPRKAPVPTALPLPEIEPSPVRTKFPTARIKRIMQADEEVGKVAQQTPIAVGKALEMFMVALVTKSADVAREKNSKRVSAQMLKQVVESDDQWDFLREIVSRVENDESSGRAKNSRAVKAESDTEDEAAPEKKRGRGGRKKKAV